MPDMRCSARPVRESGLRVYLAVNSYAFVLVVRFIPVSAR